METHQLIHRLMLAYFLLNHKRKWRCFQGYGKGSCSFRAYFRVDRDYMVWKLK